MPKQIEKTVYSFQEMLNLAENGQIKESSVNRVREKLTEWLTSDDWYAYSYECWESALNQMGFENPKINFNGFWSQGDGASFTANVDAKKMLSFMTTNIVPKNCIEPTERTGTREDFLPWAVFKLDGAYGYDSEWTALEKLIDDVTIEVVRQSNHYVHERTCAVVVDCNADGADYELVQNWADAIEKLRLHLSQAIFQSLSEEYEAIISNESLVEFDEANGYEWDGIGRLEN